MIIIIKVHVEIIFYASDGSSLFLLPDPLKRTIVTEPRSGGHHVLGRVWLLVAKGRSGVLMSYMAKRRLFDDVVVQAGRRGQMVGRRKRTTRNRGRRHVL